MNITVNGVKLATNCHHCHGYGCVHIGEDEESLKEVECGECDGLGSHFTEEGNQLANFIRLVQKAAKL